MKIIFQTTKEKGEKRRKGKKGGKGMPLRPLCLCDEKSESLKRMKSLCGNHETVTFSFSDNFLLVKNFYTPDYVYINK